MVDEIGIAFDQGRYLQAGGFVVSLMKKNPSGFVTYPHEKQMALSRTLFHLLKRVMNFLMSAGFYPMLPNRFVLLLLMHRHYSTSSSSFF